jgi:hypothetical protein
MVRAFQRIRELEEENQKHKMDIEVLSKKNN